MQIKQYTCVKNKEGRVFLRCIQEYPFDGVVAIDSPESIYIIAKDVLKLCELASEEVWLLAFNTRNILIGAFKVAQGGGNYAPTTPRDVFMRTLLIGAINIVLVHNHPSGDVKPSKGDDNVTNIMKQAADLLGINMLDHVIVGNSFYSYRGDYKL